MRLAAALAGAVALSTFAGSGRHLWHARGITVRLPPGWRATAAPLTPVAMPQLAIASYPLPRGDAGADGCEPKAALDRLPATGAFLFAWEYGDVPSRQRRLFPPRPSRFRLEHLGRYECLGRSYMLRFRAAGRYFQLHVALGRQATRRTRRLVLRVLDSLRVSRR
jgi:hypothetical protein